MAPAAAISSGDSLEPLAHTSAGHWAGWLDASKFDLAVTAFRESSAFLLIDVDGLPTRCLDPIKTKNGS